MPLSLSKLEDLLLSKGFSPCRYYVIDDMCVYIELECALFPESLLLYIPSKYTFFAPNSDKVFTISYLDIDDKEEDGKDDSDPIRLEPDKEGDLSEHLEKAYKKNISLKDLSNEDRLDLVSLQKQLKRVGYCMENIKYKAGIFYKNYLTVICRDDSLQSFLIKKFGKDDIKRLIIIIDLDVFYEKDGLIDDIRTIREGIYSILEKNGGIHSKLMLKLIEEKSLIENIGNKTAEKKSLYDSYLQNLYKMTEVMLREEKVLRDKLTAIEEMKSDGLGDDIEKSHQRTSVEKDLIKILQIKADIFKNVTLLKNKRENVLLSVDKLMFDNAVMLDRMAKNFAKLRTFCPSL